MMIIEAQAENLFTLYPAMLKNACLTDNEMMVCLSCAVCVCAPRQTRL